MFTIAERLQVYINSSNSNQLNVLYGDLPGKLMQAALLKKLFRAKWTDDDLEEGMEFWNLQWLKMQQYPAAATPAPGDWFAELAQDLM